LFNHIASIYILLLVVKYFNLNYKIVLTLIKLINFFLRIHSLNRITKTINYLKSLPEQHQRLLINYNNSLETIRHCVDYNYNVILEMIKDTAYLFENQNTPSLDGWVMIFTSINK